MKMRNKWLECMGWIMVLLVLREGSVKPSHVSSPLFPSVGEVICTLHEGAAHGDPIWQSIYSVEIIGWSLVISGVLAVVLALLSIWFNVMESLIDTLTALAHPLPGLALPPLIIMWFGTRSGAVTAIVVHSTLWSILVNLLSGFRPMSPTYRDIGRNLPISTTAITPEIRLRASMAYLILGLRIGWVRGWRTFTSAGMAFGTVGEKGGIGWYIPTQCTFMNMAGPFTGTILVIIVGMLMEDALFGAIEKHTLEKWGMKA